MTLVRILALGLLTHEVLAICKEGFTYVVCAFAPTLGLRLGPRSCAAAHGLLMAACAALAWRPEAWPLYFVLLGALTLVIASYPVRLSNHLMLGWFFGLLVCSDVVFQDPALRGLEPSPLLRLGAAGMLGVAYWASCFHKLNREYVTRSTSCAFRLASLYWHDRGVERGFRVQATGWLGLGGALVVEAALPVLLWFPQTRLAAMAIAIVFHFGLGFFGVMHFSLCMYAAVIAVLPQAHVSVALARVAARWPLHLAITAGIAFVVLRYAPTSPYRMRRLLRVPQLGFAVVTALVLEGLVALAAAPLEREPLWSGLPPGGARVAVLALLLGAFVVNCVSPYLGLKTEFSLAMFSNLRPAPWCHLVLPRPLRAFSGARYVVIDDVEGLVAPGAAPDAATARALSVLAAWRRVRYSTYLFGEVVEHVTRTAAARGLRVRYRVEDGAPQVLDGSRPVAADLGRPIRAHLFPALLPRDPSEPYVK